MKTKIKKEIKRLEKRFSECFNKYTAYEEGKYDADYYLLVGQAQAFGEAADNLEKLIKE